MQRNVRSQLFATLAVAAALCAAACSHHKQHELPPPPERLSVPLIPGAWVVGFRDGNAPGEMVQYVKPGETIENWTALFTERTFPNLQRTSDPGKSFASYKKTTNENCASAKWTMIESSDDDVAYELDYGVCKESEPRHEIGRFLSGDRALYQILWQSKAAALDPKIRDHWVDTIGQSAVVPY